MEEKQTLNFEEKLNKLNEIVTKISDNALSLDDSLKLYQEGNLIIEELEKALKEAEAKIEEVIEVKSK